MGANMGLGMWLFWIMVIVIIVLIVKAISSNSVDGAANPTKSALEILQRRYASGEIDEHEFKRIKNELENLNQSTDK